MRNVECVVCGAPFSTAHGRKKTCSIPCQQEWQRVRAARNYASNSERINGKRRKKYASNPEKYLAANKAWLDANREAVNEARRTWWAECSQERVAEAQELKPVLDRLALTPANRDKIEIMADYIQSDEYLTFVLDWYWLSDALEYLERD